MSTKTCLIISRNVPLWKLKKNVNKAKTKETKDCYMHNIPTPIQVLHEAVYNNVFTSNMFLQLQAGTVYVLVSPSLSPWSSDELNEPFHQFQRGHQRLLLTAKNSLEDFGLPLERYLQLQYFCLLFAIFSLPVR